MAHSFGLEGPGQAVGQGIELGITKAARLIQHRRTVGMLLRRALQRPGQRQVLLAIADTGIIQAAQHARHTRQVLGETGKETQRGNQIGLAHGSRAYGCYAGAKSHSSRRPIALPWLWRMPDKAARQITVQAVAEPFGVWHYRECLMLRSRR